MNMKLKITLAVVAGAARDHVGQDAAQAELVGRVVGTAGRDEEVQRRRADVFHALGQERQAVGERVLVDFLWHRGTSN